MGMEPEMRGPPFLVYPAPGKISQETNCELVQQATMVVAATSPDRKLASNAEDDIVSVRVTIPCIVNTKEIKASENIVLQWSTGQRSWKARAQTGTKASRGHN